MRILTTALMVSALVPMAMAKHMGGHHGHHHKPTVQAHQASDVDNYWRVGKSDTYVAVGGNVDVDVYHDLDAATSDIYDVRDLDLRGSSGDAQRGTTRFHAKDTTLGVSSRTKTSNGNVDTLINMNFHGAGDNSNNHRPNLIDAWGSYMNFVIGKTDSLFSDPDTQMRTLKINRALGAMYLKTVQIRYQRDLNDMWRVGLSLENPEGDYVELRNDGGSGTTYYMGFNGSFDSTATISGAPTGGADLSRNRLPDMIAAIRWTCKGHGFISLRGVLREIAVQSGNTAYLDGKFLANSNYRVSGSGMALSGHWDVTKQLGLTANVMYGKGAARYLNEVRGYSAVLDTSAGGTTFKAQSAMNYNVWAGYNWTDKLMTNVGYSRTKVNNTRQIASRAKSGLTAAEYNAFTASTATRSLNEITANVMYSPVKNVVVGVEWTHIRREVESFPKGEGNRFQFSTRFCF